MSETRVTARQRRAVVERAEGCCEYCKSQARFAMQSFSVEHIVPRSEGGTNLLPNLALACQGCNAHKHTKTSAADPATRQTVPLYHPRRQRWEDHFQWSDDFSLVIGVTPTGRATVEALKLNRDELVALRDVMHGGGYHPPPGVDHSASSGGRS